MHALSANCDSFTHAKLSYKQPVHHSGCTCPSFLRPGSSRSSSDLASTDSSAASNVAAFGGDGLRNTKRKSKEKRDAINAEEWFHDSNNNVTSNRNVTFDDRMYSHLVGHEKLSNHRP